MLGESQENDIVQFDAPPARCALVVIDELGDPTQSPFADVLVAPTMNSVRLVDAARATDMPVIFANDAHIPGLDRELKLWGEHGIANTPQAAISPQFSRDDTDYIVEKRRYSAFFQTGLRLLLDELDVEGVILCGFDTNICVRHTAADAYFNNLDVAVVTDATGTFLVGDQAEGLAYMQRCYAAVLPTTDEAIAFIEGKRARL